MKKKIWITYIILMVICFTANKADCLAPAGNNYTQNEIEAVAKTKKIDGNLCQDALQHIFSFLPAGYMTNIQLVCNAYKEMEKHNQVWKEKYDELKKLFIVAINNSSLIKEQEGKDMTDKESDLNKYLLELIELKENFIKNSFPSLMIGVTGLNILQKMRKHFFLFLEELKNLNLQNEKTDKEKFYLLKAKILEKTTKVNHSIRLSSFLNLSDRILIEMIKCELFSETELVKILSSEYLPNCILESSIKPLKSIFDEKTVITMLEKIIKNLSEKYCYSLDGIAKKIGMKGYSSNILDKEKKGNIIEKTFKELNANIILSSKKKYDGKQLFNFLMSYLCISDKKEHAVFDEKNRKTLIPYNESMRVHLQILNKYTNQNNLFKANKNKPIDIYPYIVLIIEKAKNIYDMFLSDEKFKDKNVAFFVGKDGNYLFGKIDMESEDYFKKQSFLEVLQEIKQDRKYNSHEKSWYDEKQKEQMRTEINGIEEIEEIINAYEKIMQSV